jgi:hypothetical protein
MKLRTDGRSLRLRLRRSEVETLAASGAVTQTVRFPGRALRYALEAGDVASPQAAFEQETIRVTVPRAALRRWLESGETGLYGAQPDLDIAVEKDFRRSSGASAEDPDLYSNPHAACG